MKNEKRPKLPRGLRRHSESRFIWFTWYDSQGRQHKKSTETSDPEKALLFKMRFLEQQETREADGVVRERFVSVHTLRQTPGKPSVVKLGTNLAPKLGVRRGFSDPAMR